MQISQNKYYVYLHIDPPTKEVVYVGKGVHGRAWDVTRSRTENKEHQDWMLALCNAGYLPSDWVVIHLKNLTESVAFTSEREYLHTYGQPRYNRTSGAKNHQSKLTEQQVIDAILLTSLGMAQQELASQFGVSRPAISMAVSGRQWKSTAIHIRNQLDAK